MPLSRRRFAALLLASLLAGAAAPALAKEAWSDLTPVQQEALAPLAGEWNSLTDKKQKYFLGLAKRYPSLTTVQKKRMHDRLVYWSKLTPEQRERARQKYKAFKKVPPATREQVKQMVREQGAQKNSSAVPASPVAAVSNPDPAAPPAARP